MGVLLTCAARVTAITEPVTGFTVVSGQRQGSPFQIQEVVTGDFRVYAGNRTRLVTQATNQKMIPGALIDNLTETQRGLIFSWIGLPVLIRDSNGQRIWGAYLNPSVVYYTLSSPKLCSVQFDFQSVTFDETTLSQYGGS